jgi:hypothetical protein
MQENVRPSLASIDTAGQFITQAELDGAIRGMRSSKTFLAALGAAQPIVSASLGFENTTFARIAQRIETSSTS